MKQNDDLKNNGKNLKVRKIIFLLLQLCAVGVLTLPIFKFVSAHKVFTGIFSVWAIALISALAAYIAVSTLTIKMTNVVAYTLLYAVFLIIILFCRKPYDIYLWAPLHNFEYYKFLWDTKQLTLVELVGNALLFFPMGVIAAKINNSSKIKLIIVAATVMIIVPTIELIQYFTRLGVFDPMDIFLNDISISLGFLYSFLLHKNKKNKKLEN